MITWSEFSVFHSMINFYHKLYRRNEVRASVYVAPIDRNDGMLYLRRNEKHNQIQVIVHGTEREEKVR